MSNITCVVKERRLCPPIHDVLKRKSIVPSLCLKSFITGSHLDDRGLQHSHKLRDLGALVPVAEITTRISHPIENVSGVGSKCTTRGHFKVYHPRKSGVKGEVGWSSSLDLSDLLDGGWIWAAGETEEGSAGEQLSKG